MNEILVNLWLLTIFWVVFILWRDWDRARAGMKYQEEQTAIREVENEKSRKLQSDMISGNLEKYLEDVKKLDEEHNETLPDPDHKQQKS